MSKRSTEFRTTLREWADEQRSGLGKALPDPEDLAAYPEGRLGPEARGALQERLALQPEAARELLDFKEFGGLEPPEGQPALSDRDVDDALLSMRDRLQREGLTTAGEDPAPADGIADVLPLLERRVRTWRSAAWASAIAAMLAIVVGGAWIARLQAEVDAEQGLRYSKVVDLRTIRGTTEIRLSPGTESVLLIFNNLDMGPHLEGYVEIRSTDRRVTHRLGFSSSRAEDHLLNVHVPRDLLPDGTYRIQVFGAGEQRPVKEYLYRFVSSGS